MRKFNEVFTRIIRIFGLLAPVGLVVLVSACSTTATTDKTALTLKGNEGLVGFEFITPNGGGDFQIKIAGFFGTMLRMDDVPAGESIYLYKLSKGRYCVKALYLTGSNDYLYLPGGKLPCFVVTPGKLTYGGTLSNSMANGYIIDLDEFLHSLKRIYPKVYSRYVVGPKPISQPVH